MALSKPLVEGKTKLKLQFTTLGTKRGKLTRGQRYTLFLFLFFPFNLHSSIPSLFIVIMYIL